MDYLIFIYDVKEARFYVVTKLRNFFFGVSATNIGRLTSLLHHGNDVGQVTFKALLYEEDKKYLEESYHIQIDNIGKFLLIFQISF